jgi:hypothetical protein
LPTTVRAAFDQRQKTVSLDGDVDLTPTLRLVRIDNSVVPGDFRIEALEKFVHSVYPLLEEVGRLQVRRSGLTRTCH